MILIILFSILLFAIIWLLMAPIYLYISTPESKYEAGLTGILKIKASVDANWLPVVHVRVLFIPFKIPVFTFGSKEKTGDKKRIQRKKSRQISLKRIHLILKIVWKVIRSFKLRQLILNIDTGDVIGNARLIPVFSMVYRDNIRLSVNYEDKNEFILHYENTLGRIILFSIKAYINHHFNK